MTIENEYTGRRFFKTALIFESAMIPIAIGLGVLCGIWSWAGSFNEILGETSATSASIYGLFALIPMLLLLVFSYLLQYFYGQLLMQRMALFNLWKGLNGYLHLG